MQIVPHPPPKISDAEIKMMRKEVLMWVGCAVSFVSSVFFFFEAYKSGVRVICGIMGLIAMIGFGIQANSLRKKRRESFPSKRNENMGGGPLIH